MSRLVSGLWVQAYMARLEQQGIPAFVVAKGEHAAGAILIKLNTLDGAARAYQRIMTLEGGRPWDVLSEGEEAEVDASIRRQRDFDPDLWVIEVEDKAGRHLLDQPGLD